MILEKPYSYLVDIWSVGWLCL